MITSIAFFVYPMRDIAIARRFYEDILGLKLETNFRDEWIEYDINGGTLAITTMDTTHVPGANGGANAFEVTHLDSFVGGLKGKKAKFVLQVTPTPVGCFAVIARPDGN